MDVDRCAYVYSKHTRNEVQSTSRYDHEMAQNVLSTDDLTSKSVLSIQFSLSFQFLGLT